MHGMNDIFHTETFDLQKLLSRARIVHLAALWSHVSLLFTVVYILQNVLGSVITFTHTTKNIKLFVRTFSFSFSFITHHVSHLQK
jgi:hypothetical protein